MVTSLLEDYLLIFLFFSAWSLLIILTGYLFKCINVENNKPYQLLFFGGILFIISILVKNVQNNDEKCRKREEDKDKLRSNSGS